MSCTGANDCNCGCCAGTSVLTPQWRNDTLPGLSAVPYRVGAWATFKETMLARLSSSAYPALASLKTRDDDDFTIALLDASAVVLDILAFYQERLANESYLRTAGQLRSLTELARLIGYQPSPGVAASTYLAFTLKNAPGKPDDPTAPALTIPQGTQVQSVPAQGQVAQVFETSAGIQAKSDWSALPVLTTAPWRPRMGDISVYLAGVATQLQPGDLILIVGDERTQNRFGAHWDIRVVTAVCPDTANNRTCAEWSEGLGYSPYQVTPAQQHPRFYAFRQRASLFGYNALSPLLLTKDAVTILQSSPGNLLNATNTDWNFQQPPGNNVIHLDAVYPKVAPGGWLALINPTPATPRSPSGQVTLYQIATVTAVSHFAYGQSGKISQLSVDINSSLGNYCAATRQTSVIAQSENLAVAEQPLDYPLYGTLLDIDGLRPDLVGVQVVALSGVRQKISINAKVNDLKFVADSASGGSSAPVSANSGEIYVITDPSPLPAVTNGQVSQWSASEVTAKLKVQDANGRAGTLQGPDGGPFLLSQISLAPSSSSDPVVSEIALVSALNSVTDPYPHTQIQLQAALANCYDRRVAQVNANVGLATHGQSVTEIVGSGNGSAPNQIFTLKQSPLTYIQAPTPTGRQSTFQVNVNGAPWTEVPSLFDQAPTAQVYSTLNESNATTDVLFGDGVEGALLPTGQNNLVANYRIGLGAAGNVDANTITMLMDRPLGVSGVTNPESATGGQDAETVNDIRSNASLTVLTLGRAVSLADYENYAGTFAGIAKAHALWIPSGPKIGVFLTVAAAGGAYLPPGNPTLANLAASLLNFGNPLIPITVQSFIETLFGFSADIQYDPSYEQPAVRAAVLQRLSGTYSFASRSFGQGVSVDEIAAVMQSVGGVIAVNVKEVHTVASSAAGDLGTKTTGFSLTKYYRWRSMILKDPLRRPYPESLTQIYPYLPVVSPKSLLHPAEILVLDPNPDSVVLGVMS